MKLRLLRLSHLVAFGILIALTACRAFAAPASGFVLVSDVPRTLTPAVLAAAQKTAILGQISANKKSITFHQKTIFLTLVTGPSADMLSYRVHDLRNPTLIVAHGATMKVLFVNADDDMFHNVRFGTAQKIYPNVMDASWMSSVGAPPLLHKSDIAYHAEQMTLRVPAAPGKYAYFCTVRGHAQAGMGGTIIVR